MYIAQKLVWRGGCRMRLFQEIKCFLKNVIATASWSISVETVHCHLLTLEITVNNHHIQGDYFLLLNNFAISSFSNTYRQVFYFRLYSLFLLIKPSAIEYKLSNSFGWSTCTLSFCHIFSEKHSPWTCK